MAKTSAQYTAEWRKKHPEKAKEHQRRASQRHKERMQSDPAYAENFRRRQAEADRRRREKEKNNPDLLIKRTLRNKAYQDRQRELAEQGKIFELLVDRCIGDEHIMAVINEIREEYKKENKK